MSQREINARGMKLIKAFEGFYAEAYPDPASPLARACRRNGLKYYFGGYKELPDWQSLSGAPFTIGYGRTEHDDETPILPGETVTEEQALLDLAFDVRREGAHFVDAWVKNDLTDDQYAALASFVYNAGAGTFHHSTILHDINGGERMQNVANDFLPFDIAQGIELAGLARRRRAERALFLSDYVQMEKEINS